MIKAFQLQQETAAHRVHSEHIEQSSLQLCSDMLSDMRGLEKSVNKIMNVLTIIIIIINEFHRDASLTKTSGPLV